MARHAFKPVDFTEPPPALHQQAEARQTDLVALSRNLGYLTNAVAAGRIVGEDALQVDALTSQLENLVLRAQALIAKVNQAV